MKRRLSGTLISLILCFIVFHVTMVNAQGWVINREPHAIPNRFVIGVMPGLYRYSGDVDIPVNTFGMEYFARIPLPISDDFSLYCAAGYSDLKGGDKDGSNSTTRIFTNNNPFTYGILMPGYRIYRHKKVAIWLNAGIGTGYIKSVNPATTGEKFLFPVSIDFNYNFKQYWIITIHGEYMIAFQDLDGLRSGGSPDFRKNDNLIHISLGLGFMAGSLFE